MARRVCDVRHSFWRLVCLGLCVGLGLSAQAQTPAAAPTPGLTLQPKVEKARGGQCVEDPAFMRRNHMTLLKHQRDDTVHGGIRTGQYSLKACVACHASQTSQSVSAHPGDFCQSCHTYAAVKIDCFECHANKPDATSTPATATHADANQSAKLAQLQQLLGQEKAKP